MNRSIAIVAGRSGGHIIPGLTLAQQELNKEPAHIVYFTTTHELDCRIIKDQTCVDTHIPLHVTPPRLCNPLSIIRFSINCISSLFTSISLLKRHKPEKLISMGGYISIPVCLAAKITGIPIQLYELNAVPGKATKVLAPLATHIYTCFKDAQTFLPSQKCAFSPYPIRFATACQWNKQDKLKEFGLSQTRTTLLITGGSQGSLFINTLIKQWLNFNEYTRPRIQIIHQTGTADSTNWKEFYAEYEIPAVTFSYDDALETYYHCADIIICRAGAGSLFEAMHLQKKCIIIPLTTRSTSHQRDNAYAIQKAYPDLCTVVLEQDIKKNNMTFFSAINSSIY